MAEYIGFAFTSVAMCADSFDSITWGPGFKICHALYVESKCLQYCGARMHEGSSFTRVLGVVTLLSI